eukprot:1874556-Amphidinium_carterae.1
MASYSLAKFGDDRAMVLAAEWAAVMAYMCGLWLDAGRDIENVSDAAIDAYTEREEFLSLSR